MEDVGESEAVDAVDGFLAQASTAVGEDLDRMLPALYQQLRQMARWHLSDERDGHTFGPTALVHEAYVRLARQRESQPLNRAQFFSLAGRTMRRVLVDHARTRTRKKRGGGVVPVQFEAVSELLSDDQADEILVLDDALRRLAAADPRSGRVVEMRFFGGFSLAETAAELGVSAKTVQRDWIAARAWLRKEVRMDLGLTEA